MQLNIKLCNNLVVNFLNYPFKLKISKEGNMVVNKLKDECQ